MALNSYRPALFAATAMSFSFPAVAQDVSPQPGNGDDIIVTAQGRGTATSKAPLSIQTFDAATLQTLGVKASSDITNVVPNVRYFATNGGSAPIFAVRGMSQTDPSPSVSSPVGIYVDSVYKGNLLFQSVPLFDVDKVEVLRGPQSVLFGRNSSAGVISFVNKRPDLNDLSAFATVGLASYARKEVTGAAGVPIVDGVLAVRIAGSFVVDHGFVQSIYPGVPNFNQTKYGAFRASALYEPTDRLSIAASYGWSNATPRGSGSYIRNIGEGGIAGNGDFTPEQLPWNTSAVTGAFQRIKNQTANIAIDYDVFEGAQLRSITAYNVGRFDSAFDGDGGSYIVYAGRNRVKCRSYSQDIRLSSTDSGPLRYTIGGFLYKEKNDGGNVSQSFYDRGSGVADCFSQSLGCRIRTLYKYSRRDLAAFANVGYQIAEDVKVEGGIRYSNERDVVSRYTADVGFEGPLDFSYQPGSAMTISRPLAPVFESHNVSYKATVEYTPNQKLFLYSTFSTGFRGSALNTQGAFSIQETGFAKPEIATNYEVGVKSNFLNRRIRLNLSSYYTQYKNQQFLDIDPQQNQVIINAPRSNIYGLEGELVIQPLDHLTLNGNLGLNHAEFKELVLGGVDRSGNTLIQAPRVTANVGGDYSMPLRAGMIKVHLDANYTSRIFYNANNDPLAGQGPVWLTNGRIAFSPYNGNFDLALYGKNIFAVHYTVNEIAAFNYYLAQYGNPRVIGVEATFRF